MKHEKREIFDISRSLDLVSAKNNPVFQMIVSDKITDENMDRIEFEFATKVVLFERKLSNLLPKKIKLQVKHKDRYFIGPKFNFDLEVQSTLTISGLAQAIGEV